MSEKPIATPIMRNALGRARGLGSAKEGVGHWWAQRVSAIALVPLSLWFAATLLCLASADFQTAHSWLSRPSGIALMSLFVLALCYHAYLGLRVVIEDYLGNPLIKHLALLATLFAAWLLGATGIAAILIVAFGD